MFSLQQQKFFQDVKSNIRKSKSSRTSIDLITTTSEVLIFVISVSTIKLLFAKKWLGVGRYKLNLYYFYCNARPNCKYVCHLKN